MTHWQLTRAAQLDLVSIWNYTIDRWGEDQAEAYIQQIEHDLTAAANGSKLVRPLDKVWRIKSGHHLCIFSRLPGGGIEIIRILHERMDVGVGLAED